MKQREPRRKVLVRARMRCAADWMDVVIHNMSSRGLLASADAEFRPGMVVEIRRVHHVIVGRVVWVKGRYFGLRSQDAIDVDGIVQARPPAHRPGAADAVAQDRRDGGRQITAATLAEREARSRRFASAFQFVLLVAAVGMAALIVADRVGHVLSAPLATIGSHLDGSADGGATHPASVIPPN